MDNRLISDAVSKVREDIERNGDDELSAQDREILRLAETLDRDNTKRKTCRTILVTLVDRKGISSVNVQKRTEVVLL